MPKYNGRFATSKARRAKAQLKTEYLVRVVYKGFDRVRDRAIARRVGRLSCGSGFDFVNGERDVDFLFPTDLAAQGAVRRLRQAPRLGRMRVSLRVLKPIMTPDHPRWKEFLDHLVGPKGCNFRQKKPGDAKSTTWKCLHHHAATKKILRMMDFNVEGSISYFFTLGGCCDCEVVFNVRKGKRPIRRRRPRPIGRKGIGRKSRQ